MAPDGSTVYVTAGSFGHLFFIDPAKNAPTGSFEVGQRPWGIALMPGGKMAYTANGPSNDVSLVDLDGEAGREEDRGRQPALGRRHSDQPLQAPDVSLAAGSSRA